MSENFVRTIVHKHGIPATNEPFDTNKENDLISDERNVYIRHGMKYLLIAGEDMQNGGINEIISNSDELEIKKDNGKITIIPHLENKADKSDLDKKADKDSIISTIKSGNDKLLAVTQPDKNTILLTPKDAHPNAISEIKVDNDKLLTATKNKDGSITLSPIDLHENAIENIETGDPNRLEVKIDKATKTAQLIPHDLNGDVIKGAIQDVKSDNENLLKVKRTGNNITLSPQQADGGGVNNIVTDSDLLTITETAKGIKKISTNFKKPPENYLTDDNTLLTLEYDTQGRLHFQPKDKHKDEISKNSSDITTINTDLKNIENKVNAIKPTDVSGIQKDIEDLKNKIASINIPKIPEVEYPTLSFKFGSQDSPTNTTSDISITNTSFFSITLTIIFGKYNNLDNVSDIYMNLNPNPIIWKKDVQLMNSNIRGKITSPSGKEFANKFRYDYAPKESFKNAFLNGTCLNYSIIQGISVTIN